MITRLVSVLLPVVAFVLSACSETGLYPLEEGQYKPSGPVKELHGNDCTVPCT